MKRIIFLFILIVITSCDTINNTTSNQITAYYEGFKNSDFSLVKGTLADSLVTTEGDYKMSFSRESYHEKFKWDSIFKPKYKLVSIEKHGGHPIATITVNSPKFEFLKNNPLTLTQKFYFKSGNISKIETVNFIDVNWKAWEAEKTALINWVKQNHPELDGFINDLTMKGAQDYMTAIALYKNREEHTDARL